jgi:putative FmdB family regulatory protein
LLDFPVSIRDTSQGVITLPMPTYEYACTACTHRFEIVQKFTDAPITECPECTGAVRKVYFAAGVVFKGAGWYINDSRPAPPSESSGSSPDSPAAASTPSAPSAPTTASQAPKSEPSTAAPPPAPVATAPSA